MGYYKATDILPPKMLEILQDYVDGEYIYIPRKPENRKSWGQQTESKKVFAERNFRIYKDYLSGMSLTQLADKYFLVEKSIQRIIRQEKQK